MKIVLCGFAGCIVQDGRKYTRLPALCVPVLHHHVLHVCHFCQEEPRHPPMDLLCKYPLHGGSRDGSGSGSYHE